MDVPTNPFPASDQGMEEQPRLFVGREDILQDFDRFLNTSPGLGNNEFWIVKGSRGQGKTSLREAFSRRARAKRDVACGDWNWVQPPSGAGSIAHGLFLSMVAQGQAMGPLTNAGRGLHLVRTWMSGLSIDIKFFKWSIKKYADQFSHASGLVSTLTTSLRPEVSTVVLLIDEVSDSAAKVEPTRAFTKEMYNIGTKVGQRKFNVLTVVFVQPHHEAHFLPGNDGPRSNKRISLKDFSLPEVRDVVREGLNLAGGHLTGDINEVAGALKSLAGGVPTLTLGLLRDAYEHMAKRVKSVDGEMASLTADDVHNAYCVRPNEVERRLALFSELTLTGDDIRLEKVRELVGALANDRFGAGPWAIEPLKTRMEAEIGTTILRSQAIDPLLDALPRYGFVENEDAKRIIAFRGNILRQRLAVVTIA